MKLLLIAPASGPWRNVGRARVFNGRTFRFSMLSLLTVAAETPEGVEIRILDEQVDHIPWDEPVDLVGITCMTALAPRAYEIARRFRRRGVPVVLGGFHPTICAEEAARHADAVVVGEAEGVWRDVVADVQGGELKQCYKAPRPVDLSGLRVPPRHLLPQSHYATLHAAQATRGCPHRCGFCSVSAVHQHRQRVRPVEDVVREVAGIPAKAFIFVDDNLTADFAYARSLFESLVPLRKRWITQSTLALADDEPLVRLAADAGCVGIFVGLETFSEQNLLAANKTCHRVSRYREAVRTLHAHGIGVEAGVVFGFDGDTPDVFGSTLSLLDELEIDLAQVSILTPLPGTAGFDEMQARILDTNWAHYDFHHVVFEPKRMSVEDLQAGHDWVTREFYRPWRIARRAARRVRWARSLTSHAYGAGIDLAYYGRTQRWHVQGWDPAQDGVRRYAPVATATRGRPAMQSA